MRKRHDIELFDEVCLRQVMFLAGRAFLPESLVNAPSLRLFQAARNQCRLSLLPWTFWTSQKHQRFYFTFCILNNPNLWWDIRGLLPTLLWHLHLAWSLYILPKCNKDRIVDADRLLYDLCIRVTCMWMQFVAAIMCWRHIRSPLNFYLPGHSRRRYCRGTSVSVSNQQKRCFSEWSACHVW